MRAKAQCKVNKGNPLGACGSLSAGFKPEYLSPLVLIQNMTEADMETQARKTKKQVKVSKMEMERVKLSMKMTESTKRDGEYQRQTW